MNEGVDSLGVKIVDDTPQNPHRAPTASTKQRKEKPWEKKKRLEKESQESTKISLGNMTSDNKLIL
jgi:predicted RNA-binding protein with RPS1 domain